MSAPRLLAISDLHAGLAANRAWIWAVGAHEHDWLIVAGDVCEKTPEFATVLGQLSERFAKVLWTPGNHELWTVEDRGGSRGEAKYHELVDVCRSLGVVTPEDPYPVWSAGGEACVVAPLFLLYDYSFWPGAGTSRDAVAWAAEAGILCADEELLRPDPFPTREAWCVARVAATEARLERECAGRLTVLVNHFPLRYQDVRLPRIPRFSVWCGTHRTRDWHRRFRAKVVVTGHLHVRFTSVADGVRFEEVSLGYPGQYQADAPPERYLRQILPSPARIELGYRR